MSSSATLEKPKAIIPPKPPQPQAHHDDDGDSANYTVLGRWLVLVAVMLGTMLEVLDTSIVNVAIPQMQANLGATLNQIGWVSTGYIIANVIVLPMTGWLSNHFGRRKYLTASIILFTCASFLCGHSHSLGELVTFRIFQGAGGAALLSSAQATLIEVFPRRQAAMVQSIFGVGVVFAPTLGPTLGGYITDNFSWPWIFYVNIPIGITAAFMVWNFLRDSSFQKKAGSIDFFGIFLLAVGLGCLQTVLEKGNADGWLQSDLIASLTVVSIVALYSFVVWELYVEHPVVNLRILKNRSFTAGTIMFMINGFGLYGGVFILPLFLETIRGFTPTQAGLVLIPSGVATICTLPILGRLLGKIPARNLVLLGSIISFGAFFSLSYLTPMSGVDQIYTSLVFRGIGVSMLFLPLTIAALLSLKPVDVPGGTGLYNLARQVGGSFGIAFLATYIDHHSTIIRSQLATNVNMYNPNAITRLHEIQGALIHKGYGSHTAYYAAIQALQGTVAKQAGVLTYNGSFQIIAVCFLFGIIAFFFLPKKVSGRRAGPSAGH